ncbi:MAG: trypsin-like serine protease [Hyphomicrobiales bacterium]|nr:trypsin-like serine protease [Hyphomicrobiales bacterium]
MPREGMSSRFFFALAAALAGALPARGMVGPTSDGGAYAAHVLMVLAQARGGAGFCSGVVVAPDVVLTAAHCVAAPAVLRVHYRGENGAPVLLPVRRVARHPDYRADAVAARAKSIDLALVETADPLPPTFAPAAIGAAPETIGAEVDVAGFGVSQPGVASTSGHLRRARLSLRAPLSNVLLWLDGADGAGACTGDSGAPAFAGGAVVGIVAYAQAAHGRGCGGLTQAIRLSPQRAWIESVIAGWR